MTENCRQSLPGRPAKERRVFQAACAALLWALILALAAGCAPPVAQAQTPGVGGTAASHTPESTLEVEGRLAPRRTGEISAVQAARVEEVFAQEGDRVEAGQVLLQLDGAQAALAELDAAELDRILAPTAIEDLFRSAEVRLAETTLALRQAEWDQAMAEDRLASLTKPHDQQSIDQAHANLLLAQNQLENAREDLSKFQKKFDNKESLMSRYTNRRQFRLLLNSLEKNVAYRERRYWDAQERYDDLLAPPDPVDVSVAEAELASAQARVNKAKREQARLLNGPDPDELETAQARLQEAEARLAAAKSALEMTRLTAPISGVLVDLAIKPGEWALPGRRLAVVADLSEWIVETNEVDEQDLDHLQAGQVVPVSLDAYPELDLQGTVESISLFSTEEDGDIYYTAKLELPDPPPYLQWGMTARLQLGEP